MAVNTKVVISGDTSGAVTAIGRLNKELGGLQSLAAKAFSFSGIGAAVSVAGIVALTKRTIDAGDAFAKLSQKTGTSVEDLSKLTYAAGLSGVSNEALAKSMTSLAVGMIEARDGGITPAAEAFAKLGVSVKNVDGSVKSSRAVLGELADKFAAMPDGPEKAALAVDLFGKKLGAEMIPLLNGGSKGLKEMGDEAERLGIVMSTELAKKSEEFNDNLARLGKLSEAAGIKIANSLIPALNELITQYLDAGKAGLTFWESLTGIGLSDPSKGPAEQIARINTEIQKLKQGSSGLSGKLADELGGLGDTDKAVADLEKLRKYYELQQARQTGDGVASATELAAQRTNIEKQLQTKLAELSTLRGIAEGKVSADILLTDDKRTAAQIKNAQDLQKALTTAWQSSVKEAAAAGDAAAKLFAKAADVRKTGATKAADKLRSGLSPEDQQVQIKDEFASAASAADQAAGLALIARLNGRIENAAKLTKQAEQDAQRAADLAGQIDDPRAGSDAIKQAADIQAKVIEEQAKAKQQDQKNLEDKAASQAVELAKLDAQLTALQTKAAAIKVEADIDAAKGQITSLQAQLDNLKDKTITVTVNQVGGGSAPIAGVDPTVTRAFGGPLPGRAPHDRADNMLYWGTPGEWVIQRPAVRYYGQDFIAALNNMRLPKYATGGALGNLRLPPMPSAASSDNAARTPVNLYLDGHKVPVMATQDTAAELTTLFARQALKRGGRA